MNVERLWQGRHLAVCRQGSWEYVTRTHASAVVGIVAVTPERELVLVEQLRPPLQASVIELPAGLVGDAADVLGESILDAARRELLEETGFAADRWLVVADGPSSAGLTDECVHLVIASDLRRVGPGGGVDGEDVTVHLVPIDDAMRWLAAARGRGARIDHKVLVGLFLSGRTWDGTALLP